MQALAPCLQRLARATAANVLLRPARARGSRSSSHRRRLRSSSSRTAAHSGPSAARAAATSAASAFTVMGEADDMLKGLCYARCRRSRVPRAGWRKDNTIPFPCGHYERP